MNLKKEFCIHINRKELIVILFVFTFMFTFVIPFVYSQVIQTQVIDLSERARDFFIEATKGNIQGQETENKFGENLAVGTTQEDIQSQGGTLIFLESPETIDFVSTDADDDVTGIGARSIEIFGVDENFTEISEVILMDGLIDITSSKEYLRVFRALVLTTGTYGGINQGIITGTASISSTVQIEIPILQGQSQTTHFTVPAGKNIIISSFSATMDTGKSVDVLFHVRSNADVVSGNMTSERIVRSLRGLSTPVGTRSLGNLKFDEKTDIWFSAATTGGGQTAKVEINYNFVQYAIGT